MFTTHEVAEGSHCEIQVPQKAGFDRDVAVVETGEATYAARLTRGWTFHGVVHGGFLLAIVGNALRQHLPAKPDPITMSASFVSASVPGPAEIRVDVRSDRGSLAVATAELWQGDELRLTSLAHYGDLDRAHANDDRVRITLEEPDLPPREKCWTRPDATDPDKRRNTIVGRAEAYAHPDQVGWASGVPNGNGVISSWYRLADGRQPDAISLLHVVDAMPPTCWDFGMPGWAPTVELTAHVRAKPANGWLKVTQCSRNLSGGMFEQDCEVWDSAGVPVAQARQLTLLPRGSA